MSFKKFFPIVVIVVIGLFLMKLNPENRPSSSKANNPNLLCGFEDKRIWGISPERGFSLRLSRKHATEGKFSLKVVYPKWGWPSINTKRLRQNWEEYDFLALDVYNPQKETVRFSIRLDDINHRRINIKRTLVPGMNKIKISRSEIARKIDPSQISFVVLFLEEPRKRYTLFFDNLRLERSNLMKQASEIKPMLRGSISRRPAGSLKKQEAVAPPKKEVKKVGSLPVVVARLKKTSNVEILVSSGIPFALGQLQSKDNIAIFDKNGNEIPIATKILARWPQDNSIRSVLVQFHYPVPKLYEYVTMRWGKKRTTRDITLTEPLWDYPEGMVILPPQWLCQSQVIGEQIPMGLTPVGTISDEKNAKQHLGTISEAIVRYDQNIEKYFDIVNQIPWTGNLRQDGYYSTPHVYYQFYVRSGALKYFLAARKELLYYRDNHIIQDGPQKGRSDAGSEPRYIYMQAMADDYYLTGDPKTLKVATMMAEYLANHFRPEDAFYAKYRTNFWTERRYAFPFLGVLTYYEMTGNKKYFDLAKRYMANLYKTQLQWPDRGGFIHNLYAHDPEEGARPDEYGGSPFMTGLLLEPIVEFHRLTGSKIATDSIFRALDWMINEGLVSRGDSFRYLTSENYRNSEGTPDLNLLTVHAFGYGYRLSGYKREDYYKIGMKVFARGVEKAFLRSRKHFNQNYRSSGHFLAYIYDSPAWRESALTKLKKEEKKNRSIDVLVNEDFERNRGMFAGTGGSILVIAVSQNPAYNHILKVAGKFLNNSLSAGIEVGSWYLSRFPIVSFSYRIPQNTPVGIRVQTDYGDWLCLGGTSTATCGTAYAQKTISLIDDGQWHDIQFNAAEVVHSRLPRIQQLKAFQFYTNGNAKKGQSFFLDNFRIMRNLP